MKSPFTSGKGRRSYLKEPFIELCRAHAVDIIHPDLATSGGILETKKIGDARASSACRRNPVSESR
jgi:L-alanine-DL-glutamate epimerase-like enolase superfamily enzyme